MTSLHCLRTESLLQRRAAGLSASEGLAVEEHLSGCKTCSAQAQLLDGMRGLIASAARPLPQQRRAHVIESALNSVQVGAASQTRGALVWPAAAFAGACALALLWVLGTSQAPTITAPADLAAQAQVQAPVAPSIEGGDRVISGDLEGDVTGSAELRSERGAKLALAHARVELRAQTTVAWNAKARELTLRSGRVTASVDPTAQRSFSVRTERFSVLVLGTRFEVSEHGVQVFEGRVKVVDPQGLELARVDAGQRYDVPDVSDVPEETAAPARPRQDAGALIERARAELAGKQIGAARRTLDVALAQSLSPGLRAEAMSLQADCSLVEGNKRAAATAYLRVAERFAALPAGENALFAAARLRAEHGDRAAAAKLLSRYLARYPQGRFVKEANARLRDLGESADPAR